MQTMAEAMGCRFVYAMLASEGQGSGGCNFYTSHETNARALAERTDDAHGVGGPELAQGHAAKIKSNAWRIGWPVEMAPRLLERLMTLKSCLILKGQHRLTSMNLMD